MTSSIKKERKMVNAFKRAGQWWSLKNEHQQTVLVLTVGITSFSIFILSCVLKMPLSIQMTMLFVSFLGISFMAFLVWQDTAKIKKETNAIALETEKLKSYLHKSKQRIEQASGYSDDEIIEAMEKQFKKTI